MNMLEWYSILFGIFYYDNSFQELYITILFDIEINGTLLSHSTYAAFLLINLTNLSIKIKLLLIYVHLQDVKRSNQNDSSTTAAATLRNVFHRLQHESRPNERPKHWFLLEEPLKEFIVFISLWEANSYVIMKTFDQLCSSTKNYTTYNLCYTFFK